MVLELPKSAEGTTVSAGRQGQFVVYRKAARRALRRQPSPPADRESRPLRVVEAAVERGLAAGGRYLLLALLPPAQAQGPRVRSDAAAGCLEKAWTEATETGSPLTGSQSSE